jgi:hypothetical protein
MVGQNPELYMYRFVRCVYSVLGREITIQTVIHGADRYTVLDNPEYNSTILD